jgi:hypothetical protein
MTSASEYHVSVRHFLPLRVALVGAALLALVSAGFAQNNAVPSSGIPAGHAVSGAVNPPTGAFNPPTGAMRPPTGTVPVASPSGITPNSRVGFSGGSGSHPSDEHHRHHHRGEYAVPILYPYSVPYGYDAAGADNSADSDDDEANYQGGPTVFDRRGSGADSYVPPVEDSSVDEGAQRVTISAPDRPQPSTLIVFKDGHTIELGNYAIIGATLFDLTPGHARKVALADIDLAATQRQNDDRGVSFALPASPQAN